MLKALLLVSFGLHILAVDLGVGGSLLCLGLAVRGRASEAHAKLARAVAAILPSAVTFAITLGVAPLLFVQLLYGRFLYSSSILIAVPWMSFIVALVLGYGLLYRHTGKLAHGTLSVPTAIASVVLLLWLGFLWTNDVTLMLAPERWAQVAAASPHGGALNLADPTVVPRFLHMATAMLAVAALFLGLAGALADKWTGAPFDAALARRVGLRTFAFATMAQLVVGPIMVLLHPSDVRAAILGGNGRATAAVALGAASGILAIITALRGADPATGRRGALVPFVSVHVTVGAMIVLRDAVRDLSLARAGFQVGDTPVAVDGVAAGLFFGAVVLGLLAIRAVFGWVREARVRDAQGKEGAHGG